MRAGQMACEFGHETAGKARGADLCALFALLWINK
jgi:hypothetical protein